MPVPIATRASKYLANLRGYTSLSRDDVEWSRRIQLQSGDEILGVYQNQPGEVKNSILVTDRAIYWFCEPDVHVLPYELISSIESESQDKLHLLSHVEARKLRITLRTGLIVSVPVIGMGTDGRFADLASFHSFLTGACRTKRIEKGLTQAGHSAECTG